MQIRSAEIPYRGTMNNNLPKAILFDLDDTILEFEQPETGWLRACEKHIHNLNGISPELLVGAVIDRRDWYWGDPERHRQGRFDLELARRTIVRAAFELLEIDNPATADGIAETYSIERDGTEKPFPGAIDTLRVLRDNGIRLALITNGTAEMQRDKVVRHQLEPFFDNILIEGEFGVGKPYPEVYTYSLEKLEMSPEDAWMIGDNLEWEVEAPQKLGIYSVWVDSQGKGLPKGSNITPNRTIRSITELI